MKHINECFLNEYRSCPANKSMHGEAVNEHFWSGWPGAFCLKCGDEDKHELCVGNACPCPCHNAFWESYEREIKREG